MLKLLSYSTVQEMIGGACRLIPEKGIMSRNSHLIQAAALSENLYVKGNRIFPSSEAVDMCLLHLKQNSLSPGDKLGNHHDWHDMLVNHGEDSKILIKLTDLPYQYCDHINRQIIPLTRKHVIEGTKLLHVLSLQKGIRGYSCGVPQDTAAILKPIEQYLIGFRYNHNGGGTIQSVAEEVENQFAEIRCIAEGRNDPNERSLMLFSPGPLILDAEDLYLCFKPGIAVTEFMVGSMPMMGMTGPIDPIGAYILAIAEVLGAAAVLHALFPAARAYIYPHPQAMDMTTGQMAFGTIEHARLEIIKMQVMQALGLPYYNVKDIMTSAQMPGSMAQADKALGFYTGIMSGYRAFNLMPLSTDQVWSPVQALLDIDALGNAWSAIKTQDREGAVSNAISAISCAIDSNCLFAEIEDTLMNMGLHYEMGTLHKRYFTSELWQSALRPTEYEAIRETADYLVGSWNFQPDTAKFEKMLSIYYRLCKHYHTEPLKLD